MYIYITYMYIYYEMASCLTPLTSTDSSAYRWTNAVFYFTSLGALFLFFLFTKFPKHIIQPFNIAALVLWQTKITLYSNWEDKDRPYIIHV